MVLISTEEARVFFPRAGMSMYSHVQSRQRVLAGQAEFQSYVHIHAEDLTAVVLYLVLHQLILISAALVIVAVYMRVGVAVCTVLEREER